MASVIWNYMASFKTEAPSDAVIVCCSYDLRVCDYACLLLQSGLTNRLVLSGNTGNWTSQLWDQPEAHIFLARAIENGVSKESNLVEDRATNFGENVRFSQAMLPNATRVTFVTKPAAVLRVKLTVEAQWPDVEAFISCPEIDFPSEVSNAVGVLGIINEMVGDIERIQQYPERGFQANHELPDEIVAAWEYLVGQGFNHHLIERSAEPVG